MADTQTLRQAAHARTPFSAWLGVVLLFLMFGLIVVALIGPMKRHSDYEEKRAANREAKLKAQREQDMAALTGYGWVDQNKGVVRIPIERAMELTLVDLGRKKPSAAGPIAAPGQESPAAAGGVAVPPTAPAPAASASPKGKTVEGHGSKAQPAAATNPPGAAPGTQPGANATPAASQPPVAVPPVSPPPVTTPAPSAPPNPVRGASPGGTP